MAQVHPANGFFTSSGMKSFLLLVCLHKLNTAWFMFHSSYLLELAGQLGLPRIKHSKRRFCSLLCRPWKFYYRNPFRGLKWLIPFSKSLWTSVEPLWPTDMRQFMHGAGIQQLLLTGAQSMLSDKPCKTPGRHTTEWKRKLHVSRVNGSDSIHLTSQTRLLVQDFLLKISQICLKKESLFQNSANGSLTHEFGGKTTLQTTRKELGSPHGLQCNRTLWKMPEFTYWAERYV